MDDTTLFRVVLYLLVVFTEQLFAALVSSGGNRRLPLAALNNRDFVVQISCSVCRCMGGGYLVVEIHQFEKSKLKTNIFFEFVSSGIPFTSINFVSFHIINN